MSVRFCIKATKKSLPNLGNMWSIYVKMRKYFNSGRYFKRERGSLRKFGSLDLDIVAPTHFARFTPRDGTFTC